MWNGEFRSSRASDPVERTSDVVSETTAVNSQNPSRITSFGSSEASTATLGGGNEQRHALGNIKKWLTTAQRVVEGALQRFDKSGKSSLSASAFPAPGSSKAQPRQRRKLQKRPPPGRKKQLTPEQAVRQNMSPSDAARASITLRIHGALDNAVKYLEELPAGASRENVANHLKDEIGGMGDAVLGVLQNVQASENSLKGFNGNQLQYLTSEQKNTLKTNCAPFVNGFVQDFKNPEIRRNTIEHIEKEYEKMHVETQGQRRHTMVLNVIHSNSHSLSEVGREDKQGGRYAWLLKQKAHPQTPSKERSKRIPSR